MRFDPEKIKNTETVQRVILKVAYTPKRDDGYGSWDRKPDEILIGETFDDPNLEVKLKEAIQKVLVQEDVRDGSQTPLFSLEERKIKRVAIEAFGSGKWLTAESNRDSIVYLDI